MKKILMTLFLSITFYGSFGQTNAFKDVQEYGIWLMNYYRNPEPDRLWEGFMYAIESKEITKAESRLTTLNFFVSCLRDDTARQELFFNQMKNTKEKMEVASFAFVLWYIHTDFSLKKLQEFQTLPNLKKYRDDIESIKKTSFPDLWNDPIKDADHLDWLWADFFATGNEKSIRKIITALSEINNPVPMIRVVAESAQWSLISNGIRHDKVLTVCIAEQASSSDEIKGVLNGIVNEINKQRSRH